MRFAKLNISILQRYATVDFSIVLLNDILLPCEHRYYIKHHAQPSLYCETETVK